MADRITMNAPVASEYKDNKVITLNPNGRASISFGLGKAMVIRENLGAILAFLKSDGKTVEASPAILAAVASLEEALKG